MTRPIRVAFGLVLLSSAAAAQQFVISTFAGGGAPATPAAALAAPIGLPVGVTTDAAGNVYFASADLNSVFKLSQDGALTRIAGNSRPGYTGDGGPGANAQLSLAGLQGWPRPAGLAVDNAGNLFIADAGNHRIRRISPSGLIVTIAGTGTAGFSGDGGPAASAQFNYPIGVAVDESGNLFIVDAANFRIRMVSTSGIITTVAGNGMCCYSGDGGPATSAQLVPVSIAIDKDGSLLVSDSLRIRRISPSRNISTVAGSQISQGCLGGVAVDSGGNVFVATLNTIRKISPNGTVTTVAGIPAAAGGFSGDGGPATSARLLNAFAVAVDGAGNLFIADTANGRIRQVSPSAIITVAGNGPPESSSVATGDSGPASGAQLRSPWAVAADSASNVFIADDNRIRRVSPDGNITTVAGTGARGFSGDRGPAIRAQLSGPTALALDGEGNLFFADGGTRVRRVSASGMITTIAGNGTTGFPSGLGDGGSATSASLGGFVAGLAIDEAGNLLIADTNNQRIRKVSTDGIIDTIAGGGIGVGDGGPATKAQLRNPTGIAVDDSGNLLIADLGWGRIRKVSPAGIITTVAGTGGYSGPSGDGGPAAGAQLSAPTGLALDSAGNLFIADPGLYFWTGGEVGPDDHRIRKVSPDGIITTVAGIGPPGFSGDGGPASMAALNGPRSVTVDPAGNLYVADSDNGVVRVLRPTDRSVLIGAVVDAASQRAGPVSPGKIVVIYGAGLGPAQLVQNQASSGALGTTLSSTTVSFNGFAAPILYTSATQIGVVVPYAISGTTAQVLVTYQGQASNSFPVPVAASAPSLFTANQQGWGQAAAINAANGERQHSGESTQSW